jgi:para-aminobenzoate synthetase/4-amino-4-deoxychorismate lyase
VSLNVSEKSVSLSVDSNPSGPDGGIPSREPFVLLDDAQATSERPASRLYTGYLHQHVCEKPSDLGRIWDQAKQDLISGYHVVLMCDYEWGARSLGVPDRAAGAALRLMVFANLSRLSAVEVSRLLESASSTPESSPAVCLHFSKSTSREQFSRGIDAIQEAIRRGETYQVNYTYRLNFQVSGTPLSLYRQLRERQAVAFGAFMRLPAGMGEDYVLSFSPELFVRHAGGVVTARPMKGTAAVEGADDAGANRLRQDPKNRAENLMIVDLLRNDIGRIATIGSVVVPSLFDVERVGQVWQMTSAVEGRVRPGVSFPTLWKALFPCGSITGAPKISTMAHIAALEPNPRNLYTGAIGWIDTPPDGELAAVPEFCSSVAIRTVSLQARGAGQWGGRMGVGAGITLDSTADAEYKECQLKEHFLTGLDPGLQLIETMGLDANGALLRRSRHLRRLTEAARALSFDLDRDTLEQRLDDVLAGLRDSGYHGLRLLLHRNGHLDWTPLTVEPVGDRVNILVPGNRTVMSADPLLSYKTTRREVYDTVIAEAMRHNAFDRLLTNEYGDVTEGGRTNLFARINGRWFTPPLSAGLLPGVMRSELLDDPAWQATERCLRISDLLNAEELVVCNALRGVMKAQLMRE